MNFLSSFFWFDDCDHALMLIIQYVNMPSVAREQRFDYITRVMSRRFVFLIPISVTTYPSYFLTLVSSDKVAPTPICHSSFLFIYGRQQGKKI